MSDNLISIQQVASQLRVDVCTVRRWIKSGALPAIKLPYRERHMYRVQQEEVDKIVNK